MGLLHLFQLRAQTDWSERYAKREHKHTNQSAKIRAIELDENSNLISLHSTSKQLEGRVKQLDSTESQETTRMTGLIDRIMVYRTLTSITNLYNFKRSKTRRTSESKETGGGKPTGNERDDNEGEQYASI